MRIDDTDPDELDDLDRGVSRRTWLMIAGGVLAVAALVAGVIALRGDDAPDETAATVPVLVPDTEPDVPQPEVVAPVGPNAFPDFGSDYMGQPLDLLYQRVTDTGIRVAVHDNGGWVQFEGDVVEFAPNGNLVPMTIAVGTGDSTGDSVAPAAGVAPATVPADDTSAASDTVPADEVDAPPATVPPAPVPVPPDPDAPTVAGWVPAGWCSPIGGMRVSMTYKDAIGVGNGSVYPALRDSGLALTLFSSGYAEDQHFRVLVLQVEDDTTLATATWADGTVDSAAPVKGWVVLASSGESSVEFDISLQTAAGARNVPYDQLPRDGDAEWQKACTPPPPTLPEPGEQPDDPAAAEQQVRDVFDLLWNDEVALEDKVVLDDTTGVADAIEQMQNGGFAGTAATARHTITDVVFTSPTEAWFTYDIDTDVADFTNRFGIAYRIDGVWVISRAVMCQDLALAGAQCIPFADEIRPPAG